VLEAPNSEEPTLWVVGASHHFWTHPSLPTDSAEVNKARQVIWAQVLWKLKFYHCGHVYDFLIDFMYHL
jgi:hypothetical protein